MWSDDAIALMWLASAISRYDVPMIFGIGCSALPWYPVTVELQESACSLARRTPCRGALAPLHFGQTCSPEPTLPPLWHTMVLWGARGRAATAQPSPPPPPPPPRLPVHAAGERLLPCSRRVQTSDPTSPLPLRHTVVLQGGCKGSVPEGPPIEGGYGTHDNSACDGVRGFEGSGVRGSRFDSRGPHPYGIIGPRGPVTSKRSSPEAWIPALERKNFIAPHDHPGITCAYYIDKACEHSYKRLGRAR